MLMNPLLKLEHVSYPGTLVWECLSLLPLAMWAGKAVKSAAEQTCLKAHEKGYEHGKR